MEISISVIILVIVLLIIFEYRQRKPDQIILYEKNNQIKIRKSRYYPRHSSLAISASVHSSMLEIITEAKGHLLLNVRIALTACASKDNIDKLIRAGGWQSTCVSNAVKELNVLIESYIKEFSAGYEVEDLSAEKITDFLKNKINQEAGLLGIEIISLSTQSINPQDNEITLALQRQEEERIKEKTELTRQKSRTIIARAKAQANEEIIHAEHELEMKKLDLKKKLEESESKLAEKRISDELNRKNMQLEFEKKEMELLKNNPELLMLSPQLARLAEASQNLPNAKTVVSLSQGDLQKGSQLMETIQDTLQGLFSGKNVSKKGK